MTESENPSTPNPRAVGRSRGPLQGALLLPGDKSLAHRALILGALAEGGLHLRNLPRGLDVLSTMRCLRELGARVRERGDEAAVAGLPGGRPSPPAAALDCGNSGTTLRLLTGLVAGQGFDTELTGDASLSTRPMGRVAEPLRALGAAVELSARGTAPVRVRGRRLRGARLTLAVPSAQVKSAVLLAGLFAEGETEVADPFGTRDHTERMLAWLAGPGVVRRDGTRCAVRPGPLKGGRGMTLPADPSTAAFFMAAAAAVPGSEVALERVLVNPTRTGFLEALREMGALIETEGDATLAGEPIARVIVRHGRLKAITVPAARAPSLIDEAPALAVCAALAEGETRLEGVGELKVKESDRLAGIVAGLRALGAEARAQGETLVISGPARLKGARVETLGDHRLAMAFAVAALAADGETTLSDAECAAISFPGFFETLQGLGA